MTGTVMEIRRNERAAQRSLGLDKNTRDALADYCRERWPHHTAKYAAREFDLSVDEARGVVAARSSLTTYDKIKKAGGWPIILGVEARVIGQGIDQFLAETRGVHANQTERLGALTHDLWAVRSPRSDDPASVDLPEGERRVSDRRRVG